MSIPDDAPCPRLCHLIKWPDFNGYGFHLHAEKTKQGQYIGKVDEDSPAMLAGLREGDKIVEVNFVNISNENHRQVVERIKSVTNETRLLVIDDYGDRWYRERKMVIKSSQPNVICYRTPLSRPEPGTLPIPSSPDSFLKHRLNNNGAAISKTNQDDSNQKPTDGVLNRRTSSSLSNGNLENSNNASITSSNKTTSDNNSLTDSPVSTHSSTNINDNNDIKENKNNSNEPEKIATDVNSVTTNGSDNTTSSSSSLTSAKTNNNGGCELNLNMTAAEMRQIIAQRKKKDVKATNIDLRKKYEIIQQM